jgi:hypothetical protein
LAGRKKGVRIGVDRLRVPIPIGAHDPPPTEPSPVMPVPPVPALPPPMIEVLEVAVPAIMFRPGSMAIRKVSADMCWRMCCAMSRVLCLCKGWNRYPQRADKRHKKHFKSHRWAVSIVPVFTRSRPLTAASEPVFARPPRHIVSACCASSQAKVTLDRADPLPQWLHAARRRHSTSEAQPQSMASSTAQSQTITHVFSGHPEQGAPTSIVG